LVGSKDPLGQRVGNRFHALATDAKLTVNAKPKALLKAVRIFTFPNGDVMLKCVGHEDVVIPPLRRDAKPGVGDVPESYHAIPRVRHSTRC
jgi:hypothetical protein